MPSLDDAINSVHDIILNRFGATANSSSGIAVAFEFGTPINVTELQSSPTSPVLIAARAAELMAGMANVVPRLHDKFFERSQLTVDNQYEVLLKGSQPTNAAGVEAFAAIKADASAKFEEVVQSVEGLHQFHPVGTNPLNWFDPAINENWSHFRVTSEADGSSGAGSPTSGTSPATHSVKAPLDPRLTQFHLVLPPGAATSINPATPSVTPKQPAEAILLDPIPLLWTPPPRTPLVTTTQTFQADVIDASQHQPVIVDAWAQWCGPCKVLTERLESALSARPSVQWARIDVDKAPVQNFIKVGTLPTLVLVMNGRIAKSLAGQIDEATLNTFLQGIEDTFVPTGSNRLRIDFDMCIVQLTRTWLSDGFLSLKGWSVPGFGKGDFSNGAATFDDPGNLDAVPIACVLIRNLVVNAQWTAGNISTLANAANLGPFSLHGHEFDQHAGTLTVKGMQAIAWVCAKMPLLPPDAAPPTPI